MRLTGVMLLSTSIAFAQAVSTSITADKVEVKEVAGGGKWNVTVTGTMTLSSNATKVTGYTFYFRDPNNMQVAATITPFTPPAPGKAVTFTYKPNGDPVVLKGKWYAIANVSDDKGGFDSKTKDFNVPPP